MLIGEKRLALAFTCATESLKNQVLRHKHLNSFDVQVYVNYLTLYPLPIQKPLANQLREAWNGRGRGMSVFEYKILHLNGRLHFQFSRSHHVVRLAANGRDSPNS